MTIDLREISSTDIRYIGNNSYSFLNEECLIDITYGQEELIEVAEELAYLLHKVTTCLLHEVTTCIGDKKDD